MNWKGVIIILGIICFSLLEDSRNSFTDMQGAPSKGEPDLGLYMRILKEDSIDSLFQYYHKRRRFNGAVLIAQHGEILYEKAFGYAKKHTREPLSLNHAFQLASVSKIFTATAIMLLYQDGKLDFDDELSKHIPGWPYEKMTIRNLLNHRSGMARYMAVASWHWKKRRTPMSNDDVLNQYIKHKPITFFRPNRGFNYCNTNYVILASLVEEVSGMPFNEFMQKRIYEPLKMDDAMINRRGSDVPIPREAFGYKAGRRGYYKAFNDYIDGVWGDKNMYASVRDLYKFEVALQEGELISPSTLEKAYTPGSKWRRNNYGFGWRIKTGDNPLYYHFGWWRGFRSCFIRDLKNNLTIIILSNRDHPGLNINYWNLYNKILNME